MKYQTVQVTSGSLWEFRTFYLAEPSEMKGKKHKIKPKGDISIDCHSSLTENDFHVSKNTFVLYTAVFHILHFHVLYLVMNSTPSVSLTITRCTSPPPSPQSHIAMLCPPILMHSCFPELPYPHLPSHSHLVSTSSWACSLTSVVNESPAAFPQTHTFFWPSWNKNVIKSFSRVISMNPW